MALYVAVPIVGAIVIVGLIVFLVLFLRRRKNNQDKSSAEAPSPKPPVIPLPSMPAKPVKTKQKPVVLPVPVDQPSTVVQPKPAVQPPEESDEESMVSLEENPYMNTVITLSELEGYVTNRKSNPEIFEDEFKSLPQPRNSLCVTAQTDDNKVKNRFLNIYPYDSSRVILNSAATALETDYINANYISGYKRKPKVYIATQGTRPNTLDDFWHMIWQEKADRIVMVANISEGNKTRVTPYWPKVLGERLTLGPFVVTLEGEEVSAEYTTRTMSLEHEGESRTVRQFHFTCWKDKGRPDYGPPSLLAFLRKVRSLDNISKGPLIVHCSAGVGRTGTFIALDILLKQMASENQVDIYGCVYKLRQERMTMVQVKDQYVFLHDAMVEQMKVGHFAYSCDNLSERLASLSQSHSGEPSDIDKQFKMLRDLISRPDSKEKAGLTKTNRNKNRDMNVIPYDNGRPHLSTPYSKGNDYINATLADSFKKHNFYLVTQMPLPDTIVDFWRLVWDHDCHTIIMLNEVDSEDATLEEYWPEEPNKPTQYGPIKVSMSRQDKVTDAIITRDFTVEKGSINADASRRSNRSPLEVRQFQLLTWPHDEVLPPRREDLLDLLDQVLSWQQTKQLSDKSGEVMVHCLNGRGACGVFCGVSFTLDRMKMEQEVDALMAARRVSAHRPEFFNTAAEYRALYEMAVTKIEKHNDYQWLI